MCIFTQLLKKKSAAKQLHIPPGTLDFENTDDDTVIEGEWRREIQNDSGMVKLAKTPKNHGNDAKKIRDIYAWIILCRMKDACGGKINICSTSYVTQTYKNPNTYAYQTFLKCCYCVFSFPCFIILQDKTICFYANQPDPYISSADDPVFFFSTLLCSR